MNEHDDDLESEVHEHADGETDTYPDTEDELDASANDETNEALDLDDDETAL